MQPATPVITYTQWHDKIPSLFLTNAQQSQLEANVQKTTTLSTGWCKK